MRHRRIYMLLLLLLSLLSIYPPFFVEAFNLKIYDLMIRYTSPMQPDERIAVVGIDQKSLDKYGRWPFSRDVIAKLIDRLDQLGAKVIALDILFSVESDLETKSLLDKIEKLLSESDKKSNEKEIDLLEKRLATVRKGLSNDNILSDSISKAGNVVTGFIFHGKGADSATDALLKSKDTLLKESRIKSIIRDVNSSSSRLWFQGGNPEPNIAKIQKAGASSGFLNAWTDPDGTIRSHPVVIERDGSLYPSLATAAVDIYLNDGKPDIKGFYSYGQFKGISIGSKKFVHTNPFGRSYIMYLGPDETFKIISAYDIIEGIDDDTLSKKIKDKIVFVGATATQIFDLRVTPHGITAGVEIHANQASNILTGNMIEFNEWQKIINAIVVLVAGWLLWRILPKIGIVSGFVLILIFTGFYIMLTVYLFETDNLWIDSGVPLISVVILYVTFNIFQYIKEQESKRFIKGAFERYLSPKLISQIIENPNLLKLGGERRVITSFFSDIVGFTTISERLSPIRLSRLLNEYLTKMSDLIQLTDGTVDKFVGDAVVAMWGAPVAQSDHAYRAVKTALAQQKEMNNLREEWRAKGLDDINIRIGINTGPASVGNMGSRHRFDYTMLGDTVNLASRLEQVNKYYSTGILITENTYKDLKNRFLCRVIDKVRVEGRKDSILIYEVLSEISETKDSQRVFVDLWNLGFSLFHSLKFKEAIDVFRSCDEIKRGGDGVAQIYLGRCSELVKSPPLDDWDGTYDLSK